MYSAPNLAVFKKIKNCFFFFNLVARQLFVCSERVFLGRPSHILLESRKRDFFGGGGVADTELREKVKTWVGYLSHKKKSLGK